MKLYINRKPLNKPWGGGIHLINAFYEYLPKLGCEITKTQFPQGDEDIVFLMGLTQEDEYPSALQLIEHNVKIGSKSKLVLRVNENDARKATNHVDSHLIELSKYVHNTIWVSDWLRNYFVKERMWFCPDMTTLYNGVDKEIYRNYNNKINNGKINIVSHHWSNNSLKGFDFYEKIDQYIKEDNRFTYTYIGREQGTFKNTKVIQPLWGKQLGEELSKYDVYVTATRNDPGPNHVIEALTCELPTYAYCDGGGACEFVGNSHIFSDFNDLLYMMLKPSMNKFHMPFLSWEDAVKQYFKHFQNVIVKS